MSAVKVPLDVYKRLRVSQIDPPSFARVDYMPDYMDYNYYIMCLIYSFCCRDLVFLSAVTIHFIQLTTLEIY